MSGVSLNAATRNLPGMFLDLCYNLWCSQVYHCNFRVYDREVKRCQTNGERNVCSHLCVIPDMFLDISFLLVL
jgi:hypothetical protein